jgi:hypothetical protein
VYLAVVLDAFSRRAIGWPLDATLEARLAVAALEMALERRRPAPGLVHHSDQGVQYARHDYVALLETHQVRMSMSRRGNHWDNATCESFMKKLKCEEVYRSEYRNLAEARARIGEFLEEVYNPLPLHQPELYCQSSIAPDNASAANGEMSLNGLSQPRGPVQFANYAATAGNLLIPFRGLPKITAAVISLCGKIQIKDGCLSYVSSPERVGKKSKNRFR